MPDFLSSGWDVAASDGYRLACHQWLPQADSAVARVIILHGIQSHAGWYVHLAETLARQGVAVLMPDRRGSGANAADRGHSASSARLLADLAEIVKSWNLRDETTQKPFLAGISWGGKLATIAVARQPQTFAGLALIAPGLFARVRPALPTQLRIALAALFRPRKLFDIPLADASLFTAQPHWQQFIDTDPATLHQATARFFIVSRAFDVQLRRAARRINLPVLLQTSGHDRIVNNARIQAYFQRLPSADKTLIDYPQAHHTLEFEPDPVATDYALDLKNWLIARAAQA
ncbi:MAG: alpha/beta fold hydrolase [bacterium]